MREGKRGGSLSARGTWETVHGTAAFHQNLGVDLTLTEHRSTDRLIPNLVPSCLRTCYHSAEGAPIVKDCGPLELIMSEKSLAHTSC